MNKKNIILFSFFLIIANFKRIDCRVFLSPAINDWLWYTGTIEYPLEFYFENKKMFFCWDVGVSVVNRYANLALTNNSLERGNNFSLLLHGADNFLLNDFQPLPNNVLEEGVYEFLPTYVFNETDFQINLQVSKDFQYCGKSYVHSTLRCIIPFAEQFVVNIASGNMYYNTQADMVKRKSYSKINEKKETKIKNQKNILNRKNINGDQRGVKTIEIVSPYIQVQKVGNNSLFAINGRYFTQPDQNIFTFIQNQISFPFVAFNKNFAPGYVSDSNGNFLSLDEACHSYSLVSDADNDIYYSQLVSSEGGEVVDALGNTYSINNNPFSEGTISDSALISLYTYGISNKAVKNAFYVNDPYGISYPLVTEPDYISDPTTGDLVSSAPLVYGDGNTGLINSTNLAVNTILKVVATGPYGNNPYLSSIWDRDAVEFVVPPVVVQYSQTGFPASFGIVANLKDLKQPYKDSSDGSQFEFYGDFLKNNSLNVFPKVTLLNSDGTFYDSTANYALMWYQNDYSKLLNNPVDQILIDNLNNLYITSAINPDTNVPSQTSSIIVDKINDSPSPDDCCLKVVDWVAQCIYKPIVTNMNTNFELVQEEIWSLVNVGNSIVGNTSPLANNPSNQVQQQPCEYGVDLRNLEDESLINSLKKNISNKAIDRSMGFINGQYSSMQYNGFNQSGIGNILFEFLMGSYFLDNTSLLDFYLALECPTAASINQDRSYLAIGIGNNGHYVGRVGLQGVIDIEYAFRLRFSSKLYLEHGFSGFEKLVPQLEGYPIFGILPVKMDTFVNWNGGLFYIDGSLYTNDYSGVTLSYQYWGKSKDCILMVAQSSITIPNTFEVNQNNIVIEPDLSIPADFKEVMSLSQRKSHTLGASVFSRITNELFFNCGMSRVFAGENIPAILDIYFSCGVSY